MELFSIKVGRVIRKRREALHMTQDKLAEKIGKTTGSIGQIERGETMPKITTLRDIIRELRLDANILFHDGTEQNEQLLELQTIMQQLKVKEQQLLLDFARLLAQYSGEDSL